LTNNRQKNGEIWMWSSLDMHANRQTDKTYHNTPLRVQCPFSDFILLSGRLEWEIGMALH